MRVSIRVSSAAFVVAPLASALVAYAHTGVPGALLWGLAAVGGVQVVRSCYVAIQTRTAARRVVEDTAPVVPPEIDSALRGLAHDLRSPIAAATAALAAMEECEGGQDADEAAFFRGAVRRNLEAAQQRLRALEQQRLQGPPEIRGPGVRAALAGTGEPTRS